ncbi:MAG: flippase [Eubacteriales bacterium]|nr:flippase [Eubacteriales bacterium]
MKKSPSVKVNAVYNAIRYILKIILPLISFPYVTRVLLPENYGKVNYCASIISYFMLIAALGINEYAVREGAAYRNDRTKMSKFANQIFSLQLLSTAVSYILLFLFILFWKTDPEYKHIIMIQSVGIILTTIGVDWIYVIYEDYLYTTIRSFIVQIVSISLIFLLVKHTSDYKIYAAISTMATGAGYIFNYFHSKKYIDLKPTRNIDVKKHIKPILILFCNVALISIYLNSDMTMLGIIKGDRAVGLYEVSVKIYSMIKGVLNAIVLVALPRLSAYIRNDEIERYNELAQNLLSAQIVVLFPAITGLYMVSSDVVCVMAGKEFAAAASSLRILSIALFFAVFSNFYAYVIMMTQRMDKEILLATIISATFNVILNFFAIPMFGVDGAAITTLIAEFTVAAMGFRFCRKKLIVELDKRLLFSTVLGCVAIIVTCILFEKVSVSMLLKIILKVLTSVLIYGMCQMLLNKKNVIMFLKK